MLNVQGASKYPLPTGFDLQAHRGGRGEWTEESATAFQHAIELGVTTLELDVVLTKDGIPVVWHDPVILEEKCSSRLGEVVHDLTWSELREVECAKVLPEFPQAQVPTGNRIITLDDALVFADIDAGVRFNIETKIEVDRPHLSASPQEFVEVILAAVAAAGVEKRITIQSFDWRVFPLVKKVNPQIPLVALWDTTTWYVGTPWGPYGDIVERACEYEISVLSPDFTLVDKTLIARAHQQGLKVVPWTVNAEADMQALIDLGVDGLITDYPTRLKSLLG